ncbi:Cytosolic copper metallochaperone [Elasticomyces elasticus]|nr:Cytosolic copper metallochaperone [Elasticomyces elasticus]
MTDHEYRFDITMTCGGCSGAVGRVLKKLDGIKSYDVSLDTQSVNIVAADSLDYQTILEKIKKTGKKVNKGEANGKVMDV